MRASRFIVRPGKLREQPLTTPHSATLSQSQSEGFALCGSWRLCLFRLELESASLNGGFGKAFNLTQDDLLCAASISADFAESEQNALDSMNEYHAPKIAQIAQQLLKAGTVKDQQKAIGLDPDGVDIANGDLVLRYVFPSNPPSVREAVTALTKQ